MQQEKIFDFIVVGSGIAGLNTATILSSYGKVLIVTKKKIIESSTNLAQGGIAAVVKGDDSLSSHQEDTISAGYYHNKKNAVDLLVKGGEQAIKQLVKLGVKFDTHTDGEFISSFEAAHSYPRILHATDFTGREIEKTLIANILKNKNIQFWENTSAIDLIVKNKQCFGVIVFRKKGAINLFSRAVILATGGVGQLYTWTTNPSVATGDGLAIAHRAGAKITDLEFMQFHPTALKENASPLLLLSEALRGEGALLINAKLERFMQNYHPKKELAPRDVVSRAIINEQAHGDVFLDISHKGKNFILKRFPNISRELKHRGFNLTKEPIPVTPAAHFLCGGIETDTYGRTSIKNLFAYGETAATGAHGANRLASNSLLEGMVFSNQIQYCINELPQKPEILKTEYLTPDPYHRVSKKIRNEIQKIMWQYVGIVRTKQGLETAEKKLKTMKQSMDIETINMLTTALLIIKAAQKRKESLGTHFITSSQTDLLQLQTMKHITVKLALVIFRISADALSIFIPNGHIPTETISETATLDKQVEEIFQKNLGFPVGNNYVEQLYTICKKENEITIAYYILLAENSKQIKNTKDWKKVTGKDDPNKSIISYAVQRLRWKIEYTNVVYSLLPKTFTLSDLQNTYETIMGKKLDKRNFRKKILSLKFLKSTGEKRTVNSRPAVLYTFTKRMPMLVKVFS